MGSFGRRFVVVMLVAGCGASAPSPDAAPARAPMTDAGAACQVLELTTAQTCDQLPVGRMSACGVDPVTGDPTQTGYLEIRQPDGSRAYACANTWSPTVGFRFENPVLLTDPGACCRGTATAPTPAQVPQAASGDDYLGIAHAPLQLKPQELVDTTGGEIRQNPFAIVASSRAAAAALVPALGSWDAWAGDGAPHPAPDGTGGYYFPRSLTVNYVILQTSRGAPVIVIAPEVSLTSDERQPLGHPTLGACAARGGAPLALIGGELHGATLNNQSGRFGTDRSVTAEALQHAARLFNCYGIPITRVEYAPSKN